MAAAPTDLPGLNRVALSGSITERAALRYTPAGLPALDLVLSHRSMVMEEGVARQVAMDIKSVCIGTMAIRAQGMAVGAGGTFAGFLAATRNGRGLLFHITSISTPSQAPAEPQREPTA